jgi:hypothetical protein
MKILRYNNFNESLINLIKDDLTRFEDLGFYIKHKEIFDNVGEKYNIWFGKNAKSNDYLTTMHSGKYANTLGGFGSSVNDVWMHVDSVFSGNYVMGTHLIIKTNKDNIVPDEVIKKAAEIVKENSVMVENGKKVNLKKIDGVNIVFCGKDFVRKEKNSNLGEVNVDENNKSYVVFTAGNVKITDNI